MAHSFRFGHLVLPASQVFFDSAHCYASVNLKPVVPGHAILIMKRPIARVHEANAIELSDFMTCAQKIGNMLTETYKTTALTYCIQDGKDAGQTVAQVHMHILPRKPGDFERNDDIYHHLEEKTEKAPRSADEMKAEADDWRNRMEKYL